VRSCSDTRLRTPAEQKMWDCKECRYGNWKWSFLRCTKKLQLQFLPTLFVPNNNLGIIFHYLWKTEWMKKSVSHREKEIKNSWRKIEELSWLRRRRKRLRARVETIGGNKDKDKDEGKNRYVIAIIPQKHPPSIISYTNFFSRCLADFYKCHVILLQ